jgi:uncharacterized protein (TIGR02611 family)
MAAGPGFWTRLKENLRCLKQGRAGSRFLDCFHYKQELRAKHGSIYRWTDISVGSFIVIFGLIMVPAPGPGWIIVFCGVALIAGEFERAANALDGGEITLRKVAAKIKRAWRRASTATKYGISVMGGALATAIGFGIYRVVLAVLE